MTAPHDAPPDPTARSAATRTRLLDAAVELLAEDGLQGVTHRCVEGRAGVSHGSTTYHFKTREALIEAILEHLVVLDRGTIEAVGKQLPGWPGPASAADADDVEPMGTLLGLFLGNRRALLARFELFLYASRRPHLQQIIAGWRQGFVDLGAAVLAARGAAQPAVGARLLAAAIDGILLHELSAPHPDVEGWAASWLALVSAAAETLGAGTDRH